MNITEQGWSNLLDIVNDRLDPPLSKVWLESNLDEIASHWPPADDPDYLEDMGEGDDVSWTFEAEVNTGGISDTCQRERLMSAIALILTGSAWPINGDGRDAYDKFMQKLTEALDNLSTAEGKLS